MATIALAALVSIWAPGCASRNQSVATAGTIENSTEAGSGTTGANHAPSSGPVLVTGASLITEGDSPRLLLSAEGSLSPSLFAADDGRRVVVDLPNAVAAPGMEPPRADGAVLSQLGMRTFTELGVPHVQFELSSREALDSKVNRDAGSSAMAVVLSRASKEIAPATSMASTATAASAEPSAEPAPIAVADSTPAVVPATLSSSSAPEPVALVRHSPRGKAATQLVGVKAARSGEGLVVQLSGNGEFSYEAFRLADPPRYVVDLTGVRNVSKKRQLDVERGDGAPVSRVRISQFRSEPEPVTRVVLDLTSDVVPALAPANGGVKLVFGAGASATPAAQPPVLVAEARVRPSVSAAAAPAAGSYEKHETEDRDERVVSDAPAVAATAKVPEKTPEPKTVPVQHVQPAQPVEVASADFAPPASNSKAEEGVASPAAASEAPAKTVAPRPADVPVHTEIAAAPAPKPVPAEPQEPASAPQLVAPVAEMKVPPNPAPAPRPAAPVPDAKHKSTREDRALVEAAETLLEQQQDAARARDVGSPFESRTMGAGDKVYTGEPITLNLKDADIKDTLQKFSELTGLNIVLDPEVRGSVTVSLTDIPWDQALELILKINNLGYVLEGNIMRIATLGKLTTEETNRQVLAKAQEQNRPVRTVIQKISYAEATQLAEIARRVMSPRGDIYIDSRSNTLIIKELPDYLPTVLDLIKNLDTPTPQVMIEARVVEATRTFLRTVGIDWNFHAVADQVHGNTTGLIFPNNADLSGGLGGTLASGTQLLRLSLGNVLDTFRLDAALSAAEARGLVKIISSPKVQTQTNKQASIQSGFQIPVQTTVNNTTSVLYVDATLRLDVTPYITAEGTIVMDIKVQKREPAPGVSVSGTSNIPLITRDAKTVLMVRDGGTAVIGGIFKLTANDSQTMVPGLWKIPFLGALFRNKNVTENTDELMIFITPRIMK